MPQHRRRESDMRIFAVGTLLASLVLTGLGTPVARAQEETPEPPSQRWSFDGVFGTYDRAALQRGFQVYKEVCSTCHSLHYIYFRNLTALGYTEDQVKAIAAACP